MQIHEINIDAELVTVSLSDDGVFPNNGSLPLVLYREAFIFSGSGSPAFIEKTFARNAWERSWRNGLYPFHHYHSTAHEVLGVYTGKVRVQFGGELGPRYEITAGDVVIVPAGVAHKNLQSSHDFRVVGAYPRGQKWDMNYGKEGERPLADKNIESVPLPGTDPVFGNKGALLHHWR